MKKILLINPPESIPGWPTMPRAVEPMGLLYVAGAFQEMGIDTVLLDMQLGHGDKEDAFWGVARGDYLAVGIALVSQACIWDALKIAQDLRNLNSSILIFCGGVFASLNPEWLLNTMPAIDFVVIGEAEPFVMEFAACPDRWKRIPNVYYREKEKIAHQMPVGVLTRPDIKPDRSLTAAVIKRGEAPSVVATRGCGGGCTFCCISHYYGSHWQSRPVADVYEEVKELVREFRVRRIHLVDDNLFGHARGAKEWVRDFVLVMKNFNPPLRFKTTCRLDDLDEKLIPDIKEAGFDLLKIGIETFCKETQKIYKKGILRYKAAGKLNALLQAGINVSLGFIMFDPYCTLEDIHENFDFLLAYPNCWSRHLLRSSLIAYRNTPIIARLKEDRLTTSEGITGVKWRFQNAEVEVFYKRFENLLRHKILNIEWALYNRQRVLMQIGIDPPISRELEVLFKDCWIELFKTALANHSPSGFVERKLESLQKQVEEYEQHFSPIANT
jgi:hypothetical protein